MEIEVRIDPNCKTPKIVITAPQMTDEITLLVQSLSQAYPQIIAGFSQDEVTLLEPNDILRIYAADQKVYAQTAAQEYTLRLRLYELEERLDKRFFVRISHSEIINLKKIHRLDLSASGTICVELDDHTITYVSRRYVSQIKQALGI